MHGLNSDSPGHDGQRFGLPFAKLAHRKYPSPDQMRSGTPVGLPINPPRLAGPPDDDSAHADDASFAFAPEQLRPHSPGHRLIFLLQTPEMFLRGPEGPALATVRLVRKKCRMDDSVPLQAHKKTVIVFLPLVNAGDAASPSGSKTSHKSVFPSRVFCSASPAPGQDIL